MQKKQREEENAPRNDSQKRFMIFSFNVCGWLCINEIGRKYARSIVMALWLEGTFLLGLAK